MTRRYYSLRTGKHEDGGRLSFDQFRQMFLAAYKLWRRRGYFDGAFGYNCVDADEVPGDLGASDDVAAHILMSLRKEYLWPINQYGPHYTEDDVFDMIEWLYDQVSKPISGEMHSYNDCGMHWTVFDKTAGRREYRERINPILQNYGNGFELSEAGEILELGPPGVDNLLEASIPTEDAKIRTPIEHAIAKFRLHRSTIAERRDAVRNLADVLEYLKPRLASVLNKKDESALFDIANNFHVRHHNAKQQADYDPAIWLSWMFYFYLNTIHAVLRMIAKQPKSAGG